MNIIHSLMLNSKENKDITNYSFNIRSAGRTLFMILYPIENTSVAI
jgi:hypothetical protein